MDQALHDFIHRSVAAQNQNHIGSLADRVLSERTRLTGFGRG